MTAPDFRADLGAKSVPAGDPLNWVLNMGAVDLTTIGTTWAANLRTSYTQEPPVAATIDTTNATTGTLVLQLSPTQTAAMISSTGETTTYQFDLKVSGGTVSPQHPFKGHVVVQRVNTA